MVLWLIIGFFEGVFHIFAGTEAIKYRVFRILLWFKSLTVDYGSSQSERVGILQVVAEAKASGEGGNACGKAGDLPVKIERCRLPFHVTAEGEDDFSRNFSFLQSLHEAVDAEVAGAYPVDRRYDSPKHVVYAVILARRLYAHHVAHAFHHADDAMVPPVVRADAADVLVRNHVAFLAIVDFGGQIVYRRGEMVHVPGRLAQQVECEPEGASRAHAGQRAYGLYGFLKYFGRIFIHIYMQK